MYVKNCFLQLQKIQNKQLYICKKTFILLRKKQPIPFAQFRNCGSLTESHFMVILSGNLNKLPVHSLEYICEKLRPLNK